MSLVELSNLKEKQKRPVDLRRIIGLARPHIKILSLATLALFFGAGLGLLYPQAAKIGVDDLFKKETLTVGGVVLGPFMIAAIVFCVFLAQSFFTAMRYYLFTIVGDRIVTDLRKQLYESILGKEIGFFDETKTGDLMSRLNSDTQIIQSAVTSNLSMALRYTTQAIAGVIVLFISSPKLASVMIVAVPAVVFLAVYFGRKVRVFSKNVQERLAEATAVADESIGGIRTVRSFDRDGSQADRYSQAVELSFQTAKTRAKYRAAFSASSSFFGYATVGVILWYGAVLVLDPNTDMTAGDLTAFILYTLMVAVALGALSSLWSDFMKAIGSAERVFELIDRPNALPMAEIPNEAPIKGQVSFNQLTFAYPTRLEVNALDGVDFSINIGEKIAFVGPSGSGKSTIANLVMRFYDPREGSVSFDGIDIRDFDIHHLRAAIGIVAQEPVLFSGSIRENVKYGRLDANEDEIIQALKDANAWEFIVTFPEKMDTVIGERGVRLSGGQKQRVAIARAILKDPQVLILDEATSALDIESEALVQQALERLMENRTTIIIAHRLSTVSVADKIVVIAKGKVVESGSHLELMDSKGVYHRLIDSQRVYEAVQ